ncbi:alpha/beta fold hydrolase [Pelagibius sp. CAU 1746]|uniref:alpha/beta hydrolase n=1 Tax=Pelagibius sp. CAU 1746 TaxID=3140370 RepID=UPI00325BEBC6
MSDVMELDGPRHGTKGDGPQAQARALVVFLHGLGADGNDLISLAPLLEPLLPDTAFVSPHAPYPCDMAPMGRQWFSLQDRDPEVLLAGVRDVAPSLNAFLDAELERHGLSDDRLALVGFSQGTMTALHTMLRRPKACAVIVGFSGALLAPEILGEKIVSRPPVLLVHGDADPVVPFEALAAARQALDLNGVPVAAYPRPGLQHGIDQEGLQLCAAALIEHLFPETVPSGGSAEDG